MAVNTWDGATDTDWNTAGNWNTTGVTDRVPTADDDVVIANVSNDPVIGNSLNPTINSLVISNGGRLTLGTNTVTIDGKTGGGRSIDIDGAWTTTNSTVVITNASATQIAGNYDDAGGGVMPFNNLTINDASCDCTINLSGITVAGDLTITAGELDTGSDRALTVTGDCEVSGTLTCNASAVSFGSLEVKTGATWNATSGTTTIGNDSQSTDAGTRGFFVHNGATFAHNSGTVSFTGTQNISPCYGGTATYNNVTFAQSGSIQYRDTLTGSDNWIIAGTLTINSGATLTNENQADRLNCTGDCSVSGTLNLNHASGGNHNFGSLTINSGGTYSATSGITTLTNEGTGGGSVRYQFYNNGTFTHNNGTLKDTWVDSTHRWANPAGDSLYNVIIDCGAGITRLDGNLDIANDLDVVEGTIRQHSSGGTGTLTVDGDVTIEDGGTIGGNSDAGAYTFGSLTIDSGGTYSATSGTTTLNGVSSGGAYGWENLGGTFTHNNGLVKFAHPSASHQSKENTFYDLEIDMFNATATNKHRVASGSNLKILGNLTLTQGIYEVDSSPELDIYGLTTIKSGTFNNDANHDDDKITHHGLVTVASGATYKINDTTTVKMNGGIRQLGTLTIA